MLIKGFWASRQIMVDGKWLRPGKSQRVMNHSPDGFNWGYGGSGPAQLALALLMLVADRGTALDHHQTLKWNHVAQWPQADFEIELDLDQFIKDEIKFSTDRYSNLRGVMDGS